MNESEAEHQKIRKTGRGCFECWLIHKGDKIHQIEENNNLLRLFCANYFTFTRTDAFTQRI